MKVEEHPEPRLTNSTSVEPASFQMSCHLQTQEAIGGRGDNPALMYRRGTIAKSGAKRLSPLVAAKRLAPDDY